VLRFSEASVVVKGRNTTSLCGMDWNIKTTGMPAHVQAETREVNRVRENA
jgi:hypothetical protein